MARNSLGYVAQMQEAGIPVTFAYISDVHDDHQGSGAYGPGEAAYVAALKSYDDAFGKFIADETEKWGKVVKFSGAKPD